MKQNSGTGGIERMVNNISKMKRKISESILEI